MSLRGLQIGCTSAAFCLVLLTGCQPKGASVSLAAIDPGHKAPTSVKLVMMGTEIPATITQEIASGLLTVKVMAHKEMLEREVYKIEKNQFSVVEVAGETYTPPIPLLMGQVREGDKWKWKGEMSLPESSTMRPKPSEADISVITEKLNVIGGPFDSYFVSVKLKISDGSPNPSKRELRFWFVPSKGLIKREFDYSSLREPDRRGIDESTPIPDEINNQSQ